MHLLLPLNYERLRKEMDSNRKAISITLPSGTECSIPLTNEGLPEIARLLDGTREQMETGEISAPRLRSIAKIVRLANKERSDLGINNLSTQLGDLVDGLSSGSTQFNMVPVLQSLESASKKLRDVAGLVSSSTPDSEEPLMFW